MKDINSLSKHDPSIILGGASSKKSQTKQGQIMNYIKKSTEHRRKPKHSTSSGKKEDDKKKTDAKIRHKNLTSRS